MQTAAFDVVIERFVADDPPGVVECAFEDAHGVTWRLREKVPVVSLEALDAQGHYPRRGLVACVVLDRAEHAGRAWVTVDTAHPWGIACVGGETRFELPVEQLRPWPPGA